MQKRLLEESGLKDVLCQHCFSALQLTRLPAGPHKRMCLPVPVVQLGLWEMQGWITGACPSPEPEPYLQPCLQLTGLYTDSTCAGGGGLGISSLWAFFCRTSALDQISSEIPSCATTLFCFRFPEVDTRIRPVRYEGLLRGLNVVLDP